VVSGNKYRVSRSLKSCKISQSCRFERFKWTRHVRALLYEQRKHFPSTLSNVLATSVGPFAMLRSALVGSAMRLSSGLGIVLAVEGFIVRKVAPMGEATSPLFAAGAQGNRVFGLNHCFCSFQQGMHIDQNVQGRPLTQYYVPGFPSLSVSNLLRMLPFFQLVNVWTPLSDAAIIRPLVLMDLQSLNASRDLVSHSHVNDIILLAYSPHQRYYYFPSLQFGDAVVFGTTTTPHSR
jgi:hypothetical protein